MIQILFLCLICKETMDGFTFPCPAQVIYTLVDAPTVYYGGIVVGSRIISGETGECINFESCNFVEVLDEWESFSNVILEAS